MKLKYSSLLLNLLLPLSYLHAEVSLVPPNAKAGECYAKVVIPAKYKTVEERILVQEASQKISIIPAKYEWINEKIQITPETKRLQTIPAKYKEITETIEVKPAIRSWHINLKYDSAPVSNELLVAAKLKGVKLLNAKPGTCFKEYYIPESYKTIKEEIIIKKEMQKSEIIPAKYEMVDKVIEIKPTFKKSISIPATYEFQEKNILVEKEKTVWKKGVNPAQKLNGATGEIMCLVKIPAKYKKIRKKVVKTPVTTKIIEIPAEFKTIKIKKLITPSITRTITIPEVKKSIEKKVLNLKPQFSWIKTGNNPETGWRYTGHKICLLETPALSRKIIKTIEETPALTKEITIEPSYKVVKIEKLIEEAKEIKTPIEALYKNVKKKEKVTEAYQSWERILCQTNMNKEVILKIQNALKEKEYTPGKRDGVLGKATRVALDKYQKDNSLATGGITYETLKSLKIKL